MSSTGGGGVAVDATTKTMTTNGGAGGGGGSSVGGGAGVSGGNVVGGSGVSAVRLPKSTLSQDVVYKVLLLGESGVGKTALACRAADDVFDPNFIATMGVDFKKMFVKVNGVTAKLQVWDTAGQERFHSIAQSYFHRADGCFIVFSLCEQTSLDKIESWLTDLSARGVHVPIVIIGNKADLPRSVNYEAAQAIANRANLPLHFASAKTGQGVYDAIGTLVSLMLEAKPPSQSTSTKTGPKTQASSGSVTSKSSSSASTSKSTRASSATRSSVAVVDSPEEGGESPEQSSCC
ncbi:GTP-binding protein YPTC1 [Pelomyxa schiedti]|nr:GTP-binding protein YPTC1 [Pelomyxa schiedti]